MYQDILFTKVFTVYCRDITVSQPTVKLIQSLLVLDPQTRLTASATAERVEEIIRRGETFLVDSDLQVHQ